jgi:Protein of unknown function (DUF1190)
MGRMALRLLLGRGGVAARDPGATRIAISRFEQKRGSSSNSCRWMRIWRLVTFGAVVYLAKGPPALAVGVGVRVYFDARACLSAGIYTDSECDTAYRNAHAEFDERAPRFGDRNNCERYFHKCMIGDIQNGGRSASFIPTWRGFSIQNGPQRRVFPVTDDGEAATLFSGRRIDRLDTTVDRTRQSEAQSAWQSIISPPPAATYVKPASEANDEPGPLGPVKTYPVPPAMLRDLQNREHEFGLDTKP